MKKNSFFYTNDDIRRMKELIRTGEPLVRIAMREHENFNTTSKGFLTKLYEVAKKTRKIQKRNSKRNVPANGSETPVALVDQTTAKVLTSKTIAIPNGTVFEGECKRVTLHSDHFRIYF